MSAGTLKSWLWSWFARDAPAAEIRDAHIDGNVFTHHAEEPAPMTAEQVEAVRWTTKQLSGDGRED